MASLLVIGGSGFFGKSILDSFQRGLLQPWDISRIYVLSRSATKLKITHPELISSNVDLIDGDICSMKSIVFSDYVIHAAASTDASRYLEQGDEEKKNIIQGVINYCKLAKLYHQKSNIVFCSSGAVYGFQPENIEYLEEEMSFGDHKKLDKTKLAYSLAKRDSELAISVLGKDSLKVSIARCFSFVGKYLPKDQHFAIGNFLADALSGNDIVVKASKEVYRSYMYADDLVIWLMTIAEHSNTHCPIYNVGSYKSIELHDLALRMGSLFNVGTKLNKINETEVDRYIPSTLKALNDLGLKMKVSLNDALLKSQ